MFFSICFYLAPHIRQCIPLKFRKIQFFIWIFHKLLNLQYSNILLTGNIQTFKTLYTLSSLSGLLVNRTDGIPHYPDKTVVSSGSPVIEGPRYLDSSLIAYCTVIPHFVLQVSSSKFSDSNALPHNTDIFQNFHWKRFCSYSHFNSKHSCIWNFF